MKKLSIVLILIILLVSCSNEVEVSEEDPQVSDLDASVEEVLEERLLFVYDDLPPLLYTSGEQEGIFIELIREAYKRQGIEVAFEVYPWARCIELIREHKAFGTPGWIQNDERMRNSIFSNHIFSRKSNFYYLKSNPNIPDSFESLDDLKHLTFGTVDPYYFISALRGAGIEPDLNVDYLNGLKKLVMGRYDIYVLNERTVEALTDEHFPDMKDEIVTFEKPYSEVYSSIRVWKDYPDAERLIGEFDKGFRKLLDDGTYHELLEKYDLKAPDPELFEIQYEREKLKIGFSYFPPYEFSEDGYAQGISLDLLRNALARLGYGYDDYVFLEYPWSRVMDMVKAGELDLALSMIDTPERRQFLHFSEPIGNIDFQFHTNSDKVLEFSNGEFSEKDLSIGLIRGYSYTPGLIDLIESLDMEVIVVDSTQELIQGLLNERYPLILEDHYVVAYHLKLMGKKGTLRSLGQIENPSNAYIGFPKSKEMEELWDAIDREMEILRIDGTRDRILQFYLD